MRKITTLAAKVLISAGMLYFAMRGIDYASIASRLNQMEFGWIAIAFILTILQIYAGSVRWDHIAGVCGFRLGGARSFRYSLIGAFFNQTLPSSIGGDAMRVWLMAKAGANWRTSAYSVLVDRAIGLIVLATIVVASLPWSLSLIANLKGRIGLLLVDALALSAGLVFLLLGLVRWQRLIAWSPVRHLHACSRIASAVLFDWRSRFLVAGLSVAIHLATVAIAWFASQAIQAPVGFFEMFCLVPPIILITIMPVSIAGWGLRETTMMIAFGYAGLPQADGVIVSVLFGALSFVAGSLGGILWVSSQEKAGQQPTTLPLQ
ncbi:hypothetical protein SAMN05216374_0190 [Tardiphaga sp. OK246]|uniref:lysylphosphatidylglycerol synthase transmembrane domain-containing protein n=1 Tax=Tardiphaga sp. OK246 TaxID=1855307 RepID=UPI000B6EE92D|nr:lysylphosphatidylglycerol synthase transmembrane domain-containing protein [Tardiphaga sp. OK246]SNT63921.1 hypothetical protein SAMN05216374_0190 [Tardiphaga sp. OK246]